MTGLSVNGIVEFAFDATREAAAAADRLAEQKHDELRILAGLTGFTPVSPSECERLLAGSSRQGVLAMTVRPAPWSCTVATRMPPPRFARNFAPCFRCPAWRPYTRPIGSTKRTNRETSSSTGANSGGASAAPLDRSRSSEPPFGTGRGRWPRRRPETQPRGQLRRPFRGGLAECSSSIPRQSPSSLST